MFTLPYLQINPTNSSVLFTETTSSLLIQWSAIITELIVKFCHHTIVTMLQFSAGENWREIKGSHWMRVDSHHRAQVNTRSLPPPWPIKHLLTVLSIDCLIHLIILVLKSYWLINFDVKCVYIIYQSVMANKFNVQTPLMWSHRQQVTL